MGRGGKTKPRERRKPEPRPAPLPPEKRTVGQLVAESIQFYRRHFWQSLPLGLSFAAVDQLTAPFGVQHVEPLHHPPPRDFHHVHSLVGGGIEMVILIGGLLLTASYIVGVVLVSGAKPTGRQIGVAFAAGFLVYIPVPLLTQLLILPAVLYLALAGWVVPAILVEGASFRAAFGRSLRLARTDYVYAAGSLATLVILFGAVRFMMLLLIHFGAETGKRGTLAAADLVLSPLFYIGAAIVFMDLVARERARQ